RKPATFDDDDQDEEASENEDLKPRRSYRDDDDDDDDNDEEDEDDYEGGSRPKKKRRTAANQYLDVEAEVSDEEEEEDEEEAERFREEFIANEDDDPTVIGSDYNKLNDNIHREYDLRRDQVQEDDAERLAEEYKAKYGRMSSSAYQGEQGTISQRLLLPSVDDPNIWAIKCRQGKEKELIRLILQKKLNLQSTARPLDIYTAFQRDNFAGYIYIEARRPEAVDYALKGLVNVFTSQPKLLVPVKEFPDLLRAVRSTDVEVKPGLYVRITRGKYKNDLAIVEDISENGLEARLKVVPRLDYGRNQQSTDADGKKKRAFDSKNRPLPRLFSERDAKEFDEKYPPVRTGQNQFNYRGNIYVEGFLIKDFKIQFLQTKDVQPTLDELTRFSANSGEIDLSSIAQTLKKTSESSTSFQPGDRVQIVKGELTGLTAIVTNSEKSDIISVKLEKDKNNQILQEGKLTEIPATDLRKMFVIGDHVRVIYGKHIDDTGLVITIDNDQVTLISDQSQKDVTVFANYLMTSTDSLGLNRVGEFELHDLVQLNNRTVGIIVKADREVLSILCQDGRIVNIAPSSIALKINQNKRIQTSTDQNGLEIKIGDKVRESSGERRDGTIEHIYKSILFLKSRSITENSGIFVTNCANVTTISTKGALSTIFTANRDLAKMNPNRQIGGSDAIKSMGPPVSRTFGRDRTINQRVIIRKGPKKGIQGIIKDADGDIARVELHSSNKIISIDKSKLSFFGKDGRTMPYEHFIAAPNLGKVSDTYYTGGAADGLKDNRTPSWNGARSQYGAGKTPLWTGGNKTLYGGSRDPAYSSINSWSSGGNSTSYGGATAYGGGRTAYGGGKTAYGGGRTVHGGQSAWGTGAYGGKSGYGTSSNTGGNGSGTSYGGASVWNPNSENHTNANQWKTSDWEQTNDTSAGSSGGNYGGW
ncbi:transcription elongation factor SPT5, partial [Ascoidea rubescens DSM 1968]